MVFDDFFSIQDIRMHANMVEFGCEKRMDTHDQIWINFGAKNRPKNDQTLSKFEKIWMTNRQQLQLGAMLRQLGVFLAKLEQFGANLGLT